METLPQLFPDKLIIGMKSPTVSVEEIDCDKTFIPRKPHTKSRGGCLSCKRRRQKCDEAKPRCSRCEKLCFECEYKPVTKTSRSPPSSEATTPSSNHIVPYVCRPKELNPAELVDDMFQSSLAKTTRGMHLPYRVSELLSLWVNTNFVTFKPFGDIDMQRHYRTESIRLSLSRPYLMHCLVCMASINRKGVLTPNNQVPDMQDVFLWQQGLKLFKERLARPVSGEDAEALISTSAFINGCSFAFITSMDPAQSWPNVTKGDALAWLRVMTGPRLMLSQLRTHLDLEKQPAPAAAVADRLLNLQQTHQKGTEGIPPCMVELFELDEESTPSNNVYHGICRVVASHLDTFEEYKEPPDAAVYFKMMAVYQPALTDLLEERDERALLLLCMWYAIIHCYEIWWNGVRATIEGRAICMYLDRHTKDDRIRDLLEWPAKKLGYVLQPRRRDDADLAYAIAQTDTCSVM